MPLNNLGGGGINNGGGAITSESDPTALKLVGGQMSNGAVIDIRDVPNNSDVEVAGWGFGVEQTDASTTGATLENTGLHVYSAGSGIIVSASAITFPDSTIQTTAYTGGVGGGSTAWGDITGTLSNQTDLQGAIDAKYDSSNPAGFVDSTYVNGQGFITSSALTGYATESFVGSQGFITQGTADALYYPWTGNPSGFVDSTYVNGQGFITSSALTGYATESFVTTQGYITQTTADGLYYGVANTAGFITQTTADGLYYAIGNPSAFIDASALTGYATESFATSQGFITDAPADGTPYARQDNSWISSLSGSFLPLAGGTMTGNIIFGTGSQYIGAGTFDTSRGGSNGLSLVCAVGYEFNWQAGWLTTTEQNSTTPRPLYLDSAAGTTLRSWDSATDTGTKVAHTGINIGNTSVYYVDVTPDTLKVFESTNELGVTIAHDSIAIQHIDTPNVTSYFTNEYIGFEDVGGTPHSAYIEHDVITVQDATETTQIHSTGVSLSAGGSITFGDASIQTTAYNGISVPVVTITSDTTNLTRLIFQPSPHCHALIYPSRVDVVNGSYATSFTYQNDTINNPNFNLSGLTSLSQVQILGNSAMVNGPSFSNLTSLITVQLGANSSMLSNVNFTNCTSLHTVNMYSNVSLMYVPEFTGCTNDGMIITLTNCALTNCDVLLDVLDANGCINGSLNISGGTNQQIDPTYSSLTSLQGKGWTVIFNSL